LASDVAFSSASSGVVPHTQVATVARISTSVLEAVSRSRYSSRAKLALSSDAGTPEVSPSYSPRWCASSRCWRRLFGSAFEPDSTCSRTAQSTGKLNSSNAARYSLPGKRKASGISESTQNAW
jgi:hypothetical protein